MSKAIDKVRKLLSDNSKIDFPADVDFRFSIKGHITYNNEVEEIDTDQRVKSAYLSTCGDETLITIEIEYEGNTGYLDYYTEQKYLDFFYDRGKVLYNDTLDEIPTDEQWQRLYGQLTEIINK